MPDPVTAKLGISLPAKFAMSCELKETWNEDYRSVKLIKV